MSEQKSQDGPARSAVVAIYKSHEDTEAAVLALEQSGCDMTELSVVGKDYQSEEHIVGYYNIGNRMGAWSEWGTFWGGLWALLSGSAFLVIPGIGHVLIAGPLASEIVTALESAALTGGMNALAAGLFISGIPKDTAIQYETQIMAGKFLLIHCGTDTEVTAAKSILELTNHQGVNEHTGACRRAGAHGAPGAG
jgi:hypothetical protein